MTRYRIREETHADGSKWFYPQSKGWLLWHYCYYGYENTETRRYRRREGALEFIEESKRMEKQNTVVSVELTEI